MASAGLLALLVMHVNAVVSVGHIADARWPGRPAQWASNAAQRATESCLRRTIGADVIVTHAHGSPCHSTMRRSTRGASTADGLGVYRAHRRLVDNELGLSPSAALRDLEGRILRDDMSATPAAHRRARAHRLSGERRPRRDR